MGDFQQSSRSCGDGDGDFPAVQPEGSFNDKVVDVYAALRSVARRVVNDRSGERIVEPTELVHECYIKLMQHARAGQLPRTELIALAATAIRTLLVDRARELSRLKRGGGMHRVTLNAELLVDKGGAVDVLALDSALARFAELDARAARVVELRFFGGLSIDATAKALEITPREVDADWDLARAWLHRELAP